MSLRASYKPPPSPECVACHGASGRPHWGVVWGASMCEACAGAWFAAPEVCAVAQDQTKGSEEYRAATQTWLERRRKREAA